MLRKLPKLQWAIRKIIKFSTNSKATALTIIRKINLPLSSYKIDSHDNHTKQYLKPIKIVEYSYNMYLQV